MIKISIEEVPGRSDGAAHRDGIGDAGHRTSLESRLRLEDAAHDLSLGLMPKVDLTVEEKQRISEQVAEDLRDKSQG